MFKLKQLKMNNYYIYILSNKNRTTFYIGVTQHLTKRIFDHANNRGSVFTKKYQLSELVYYEEFLDINQAIFREKQLKNWKRKWKIDLIKSINPNLETLEII